VYYNSNQNSNEYYSSYKQELSAVEPNRRDKNSLSLPIKIGIGILLLGLIGFGSSYLVQYLSTEEKEATSISSLNKIDETSIKERTKDEPILNNSEDINTIPKIVISEEKLPKSIQLQDSESKIISNLKQNATDSLANDLPSKSKEHNEIRKQVISLTETSNMNSDDIESIVNIILSKKNKQSQSSLEKELLDAELVEDEKQTLKESNHYNKVVLSAKNESSESKLIKLNKDLEKSNKEIKLSKYEKALKPEIATRSNEMRIIIVKKGDSLSKLAQKAYGNKFAYKKIFKANPEIIKNPNQIFVGQKIRIPL
jgi:hypothetical protein